mgnify:CR=1 FL=1
METSSQKMLPQVAIKKFGGNVIKGIVGKHQSEIEVRIKTVRIVQIRRYYQVITICMLSSAKNNFVKK